MLDDSVVVVVVGPELLLFIVLRHKHTQGRISE